MQVNIFSFKDTGETRTIFVWSDNVEIRSGNETDDIVKGLLNSFLNNSFSKRRDSIEKWK